MNTKPKMMCVGSMAVFLLLPDSPTRGTPSSTTDPSPSTKNTTTEEAFPTNSSNALIPALPTALAVIAGVVVAAAVVIVIIIICCKHRHTTVKNPPGVNITTLSPVNNSGESHPAIPPTTQGFYAEPENYEDPLVVENTIDYEEPLSNSGVSASADPYESPYDSTVHSNSHTRCIGQVPESAKYGALEASLEPQPYEENSITSVYRSPGNSESALYSQLEEMQEDELTRDSVRLGKKLGSGQFGEVYSGVWERVMDDLDIAIKTLKEDSGEEERVKFLQEAAIMAQFKHSNIVATYGVISDGQPILLVLELLSKGDLKRHLRLMRSSPAISGCSLLSYCRQVVAGMQYLAKKCFIHRDLAARNILISQHEICKIADFGMSRDLLSDDVYRSKGGVIPIKWTSPEALHYKKYSTASDVWSYGILLYEIWSLGEAPYKDVNNQKMIKMVDRGFRLPPPPGCPRAVYRIMIHCWHPTAEDRLTFDQIKLELSVSDSELLNWNKEDLSVHPEASNLGASLHTSTKLYYDLQKKYCR